MKKLLQYCYDEIEIKRSRFLAECFPVKTQSEVRTIIKAQKEKHSTAKHVVHAFIIGEQKEILGASDDGEPQGTAGSPILTVLKNSDISHILVTVTRWFGGVLLGTGGLVKAYSTSTKNVIEKAESLHFVIEEIKQVRVFFEIKYTELNAVKKLLSEVEATHIVTDFSDMVTYTCEFPLAKYDLFKEGLTHITRGLCSIQSEEIKT